MEGQATPEIWQIEASGQVYEAPFEELTAWIAQGSLLRIDRVRKGNLRWIEAGKVPALLDFFNAKDAAAPPPPVITTTMTELLGTPEIQAQPVRQFTNPDPVPPPTPN